TMAMDLWGRNGRPVRADATPKHDVGQVPDSFFEALGRGQVQLRLPGSTQDIPKHRGSSGSGATSAAGPSRPRFLFGRRVSSRLRSHMADAPCLDVHGAVSDPSPAG